MLWSTSGGLDRNKTQQFPTNNFKKKTLHKLLFDTLNSEDYYIDMPNLIQKVILAKNVAQ